MTRALFFGTPVEALPALAALPEVAETLLVVTRPDRPRGRSGERRPSAVKVAAVEMGVPVVQPERPGEVAAELRRLAPDVGVVVAYGALIPPEVLEVPPFGLLNLHFSILPRWRGAAPVVRAILAGDAVTGVSLMRLQEGLDTGPLLAVAETPIFPEEAAGDLTWRLARMGAALLRISLPRYLAGELEPRPQEASGVTYASKVDPREARLDPTLPAEQVLRAVRAFNPRPGAWGLVEGGRFKVWRAALAPEEDLDPGVLELREERLLLGTGRGSLELLEVQPEGKSRMTGEGWAHGRRGAGARLE